MTKALIPKIIGGLQCLFGAIASIFAYIVYASAPTREALYIGQEEVIFLMFLFLVFGVFSIASGMILLRKKG